ncbi:MAG: histidine kinase [Opitutae bacterium]|nr:histidine kinase [Opitutae bacterium]
MRAEEATLTPLPRPTDGLADARAGLFRQAMRKHPPVDTAAKLQRAKERLYVLCQVGGWGVFLLMQIGFSQVFAAKEESRSPAVLNAMVVMIIALGLLITHYSRPLFTRWGWKQLSWRALVPRVLATAAGQSLVWSALGYGLTYGLIGLPWTSKYSPALIFTISWFNGCFLLVGWLCLYFFYHLFERLNRLQVEQLRLAASVKEAELRALKSQVNPHFLFNSLNSLRALIDEDAPRAREAVTRLANMLRYSLQSGQL